MHIQKELQHALRCLARSGHALIAVDGQNRIVFWNEEASRQFGVPEDGALGENVGEVLGLEDARGRTLPPPTLEDLAPIRAYVTTGADRFRVVFYPVPLRPSGAGEAILALLAYVSRPRDREAPLTPREGEILRLLADGLGTAQIAQRLFISPTTVRNHVQNVLRKLDVHSRIEAVAWARRQGLLNHNGDDEVAS